MKEQEFIQLKKRPDILKIYGDVGAVFCKVSLPSFCISALYVYPPTAERIEGWSRTKGFNIDVHSTLLPEVVNKEIEKGFLVLVNCDAFEYAVLWEVIVDIPTEKVSAKIVLMPERKTIISEKETAGITVHFPNKTVKLDEAEFFTKAAANQAMEDYKHLIGQKFLFNNGADRQHELSRIDITAYSDLDDQYRVKFITEDIGLDIPVLEFMNLNKQFMVDNKVKPYSFSFYTGI